MALGENNVSWGLPSGLCCARGWLTYAVECGFGGITGRIPANFMLPDPKSD